MITEQFIRDKFIHDIVCRGLTRISRTQERVAERYFTGGTGRMKDFFSRVPIEFEENSVSKTYYLRTLAYVRFLDIKYSKGSGIRTADKAALYNRVVWGVMFGSVLPDLRYGLTDEVRKTIREQLQESL